MLTEKPWKLEAVARLFLGVIIALCASGLLAGLVAHFSEHWPKAQSEFWQIVVSASFLEIPALCLIALFLAQHHVSWKHAFGSDESEPATAVAYGVMGGALFVPAAWGLQILSSQLMVLFHTKVENQQMVDEMQNPGLNIPEKAFLCILAVVIAPVVEEMLFRGILYPAIKQRGWPRLALWSSSILFALAHANMASFLPLLIFAIVLARLYESFENLLAPIAAHSLFNAANFMMLVFQDQIKRVLHLT